MIPLLVLAAGEGKRLGEIGRHCRKVLLPVGDGTLLSQHFRTFLAAGTRSFVVVTDPGASDIEAEARRILSGTGASLSIVRQEKRLGIGHAALLAERELAGGPFALVLGDTFYSAPDIAPAVREITSGRAEAVLSVRRVEDEAAILRECTIEKDGRGLVRRIVEKPARALSMEKPCGVYFFSGAFMDALRGTPPSALRGEVELTDAIQRLIDSGGRVAAMKTLALDVNITFPADVIAANLAWLREKGLDFYAAPGAAAPGAVLERSVAAAGGSVGAGARLARALVFPGGSVPAGAALSDAVVLPGGTVALGGAAAEAR